MTIHDANQRLLFQLYEIYDNREAANIADLVMEHLTGWKKIDRIINKHVPLLQHSISLLEQYTEELLSHKPVQYVLHEAWFFGRKFFVNEHVLIPRPETEELVEWIVNDTKSLNTGSQFIALDIGTGSGCIPVILKNQLPFIEMLACDISRLALEVAEKNADAHDADIAWLHFNFLDSRQWDHLPGADLIVSNPPYIPQKDIKTMRSNVVQYEPHLALFVDNNDPLLFYTAIANFAADRLNNGGRIFLEIHEKLATEVQEVFRRNGFENIEVKKDMQGKDRMVRVRKV